MQETDKWIDNRAINFHHLSSLQYWVKQDQCIGYNAATPDVWESRDCMEIHKYVCKYSSGRLILIGF